MDLATTSDTQFGFFGQHNSPVFVANAGETTSERQVDHRPRVLRQSLNPDDQRTKVTSRPTASAGVTGNSSEEQDENEHGLEEGRPVKRARLQTSLVTSDRSTSTQPFVPIAPSVAPRRLPAEANRRPPIPRTKTGCYTCRKRRVKCDQTRPTCRRCAKAKVGCEGYDPTLEPGPPILVPALDKQRIVPNPRGRGRPRKQASTKTDATSSGARPVAVKAPTRADQRRQGKPAINRSSSSSSKSQSRSRSSSGSVRSGSRSPDTSDDNHTVSTMNDSLLGAHFGAQLDGDIEFTDSLDAIAVDPALAPSVDPTTAPNSSHLFPSFDAGNFDNVFGNSNGDQGGVPFHQQREPLTMASLCKVGGEDPPRPLPQASSPPQPDVLEEIDFLYKTQYAPGIDAFLECNWYSQHSSKYLLDDSETLTLFTNMLHLFKETNLEQYDKMRYLPSAESQLVWALMRLARTVPADLAQQSPELQVVLNRLLVVECLITSQKMDEAPISPGVIANTNHMKHPQRMSFWKYLNYFVGQVKSSSATSTPATPAQDTTTTGGAWSAEDARSCLDKMRKVLGELENRDVLYSVAVVQHYGMKFPHEVGHGFNNGAPANGNAKGQSIHDKDDLNKLRVAKRFLEDEASGNGLTQVVQRLCGMAVRSWSHLH